MYKRVFFNICVQIFRRVRVQPETAPNYKRHRLCLKFSGIKSFWSAMWPLLSISTLMPEVNVSELMNQNPKTCRLIEIGIDTDQPPCSRRRSFCSRWILNSPSIPTPARCHLYERRRYLVPFSARRASFSAIPALISYGSPNTRSKTASSSLGPVVSASS